MAGDGSAVHNEFSGSAWFVVQARDIHGDIHIHSPSEPASASEAAVVDLARAVRSQWRDEAAARDLFNPAPLAVAWAADATGDAGVSDHVANVGGTADGRSDDISGLVAAFRSLPHRRLVLLGEAGSGKTTLAMLLVLELLALWTPADPVPVLFPIEGWDPARTHLRDWLVTRITADHPGLRASYGADVVRRLVRDRRVLPVLDGLDELPPQTRATALTALNRALDATDPIILTSRTAEYTAAVEASDVLRSAAVLRAQPVQPEAVEAYLRASVPPQRTDRWQPMFDGLRNDGSLRAALSNPLNVWLLRVVHAGPHADPRELLDPVRFPDARAIEHHLLDRLVPALYAAEPSPGDTSGPPRRTWPAEKAERWLRFLAGHLTRASTENLWWWELDRASSPRRVLLLLRALGAGLILLSASCAGRFYQRAAAGTEVPVRSSLVFVFVVGSLLGVFLAFGVDVGARLLLQAPAGTPTGRMGRPGFSRTVTGVRQWLRFWPVRITLVLGVAWVLLPQGSGQELDARGWALIPLGMLGTVLLHSVLMFPAAPERAVSPERLLAGDRTGVLLSTAVTGPLVGAVCGVTVGGSLGTGYVLAAGAGGWLSSAALSVERSAWGRWLVAKAGLGTTGRLPWAAMAFLRDARHRGLLRQNAGAYQFRHARLREHLVASTPDATAGVSGQYGELRMTAWSRRPLRTALRRMALPPTVLVLNAVALPVTWIAGAGTTAVLTADAVWLVGAAGTAVYLCLRIPRRRVALRVTADVIEGGTPEQPFRYGTGDIAELTVMPLRVRLRRKWRAGTLYALHCRLRPGTTPPPYQAQTTPDEWIPLWRTGTTPHIRPELAAALSRFAGDRWRPGAPELPPGLTQTDEELRFTASSHSRLDLLMYALLRPRMLFLDAVALTVTWGVGIGTTAVLTTDLLYLVAVVALVAYFAPKLPRWRDLRITADVIEGGTAQRPFRYRTDDIAELAVRPVIRQGGTSRSYYAIHARLRPGVPPAESHSDAGSDGWIPLWGVGTTPDVHPSVSQALARFAGARWRPDA
ncbi:NACHT domain-containing protein [Streptomyces sp. MK5]|uniref:NACHT domain-containing protein n=1 Tax=Streptomyces sp. MK5 TaxID=3064253 RepID=UPI002740C8A2|nr:NACHT domain-containing protein [Streptomyces sp. MK5]